ncbi:hypothetical protein ACQEVZ_03725 [Dactylosporangium sp. CA-152071]|uniref:hypothetical protein n=1 Tax=Dactylosporangium sp. CA-152071 TaxID=3239933 RepID=UPI003D900BC1
MWRRCAVRYLVPELPGAWGAAGALLHQGPDDWILRCVVMSTTRSADQFKLGAHVQLLAVPTRYLVGPLHQPLRRLGPRVFWDTPATVTEAGPGMAEIAEAIRAQAVPYLDTYGTTEALQRHFDELVDDRPFDIHFQEAAFCLRLINGDVDGALAAAAGAVSAAAQETRDWAQELAGRVSAVADQLRTDHAAALRMLRTHAGTTRQHLRLPPPA